jgi:hypothetical protein
MEGIQMKELYTTVVFKHKLNLDKNPLLTKYEDEQLQWAADQTVKAMLDSWLTEANNGGSWGKMEYVLASKETVNG